jgi:hypothetical protein
MGFLNKERVTCLVALVIGLYGLATAFSGEAVSGAVQDIPPPGDNRAVPTINVVKVSFLNESFDHYWGAREESRARDPWVLSKETARPTVREFPMPEPQLKPFGAVVPVPPYAPVQNKRPVIRQSKPPVSIEGTDTGDGTDENGTEGNRE